MPSLEQSVRHHLAEYLAENEAYDDFVDWMYGVIWNIEQRGEQAAARLGYAIMLAIAEFDDDVLTRERFQNALRQLAEPAAISA
ncbi:MAG: hypothetical protein QM692_01550 [Thermomicrobiales bacterium]